MAKTDVSRLPYRPSVGVMLLNPAGLVFVGRRTDTADAWQMPQGGIDPGETPGTAALRELQEEAGTDRAKILALSRRWLRYELPDAVRGRVWGGRYRGQKQKWVAARFTGTDSDIDVAAHGSHDGRPEFDAWRWVDIDLLPELAVWFKRPIYEAVIEEFRPLVATLARR